MPVFEFRLTCVNENLCKGTQLIMSDFKNKNVKSDKIYDHIAIKKFPSWNDAINASKYIKKQLGGNLVDLTIAEK